ncbi:tape measure protein [Fibrella sp. WM1]|uniref:tape measure protein n=1 Tax=Fibrella musci TaxID=3242485 RepID=UPI00351F85DF
MMDYNFRFHLIDLVGPKLLALQGQMDRTRGRFAGLQSLADRLNNRFSSAFRAAGGAVARLTTQFDRLRNTGGRSVDSLNIKLDALTKRRNLSVNLSEIRGLNRQIEDAEARMNRLSTIGRRDAGGGGMLSKLMGAAGGLLPGMGVAGAVAGGVKLAGMGMNREQVKVAFEQFVGKQGVDPLMGQLNKFADVTPYSNEDVYGSARTLLSAKVNPAQLNSVMTQIGNMAAVSQKDFGELSAAYGKIMQKGFIDGGELHQEFGGTALMDQLKKTLKVDGEGLFKMAEKRQIRSADVATAFENLSEKGELYSGGLDKLSQTAGGKWSTFLGTLENKVTEWAEKLNPILSKIFDFGTGLLGQIDPFLAKLAPLKEVFVNLWQAGEPIRSLFAEVGHVLYSVAERMGLVGENGTGLTGVVNGIVMVSRLLSPVLWSVYKVVELVGRAFLWVATPMIDGFVWAAKKVMETVTWLNDHLDTIKATLYGLLGGFKNMFSDIVGILTDISTLNFIGLGARLASSFKEGFQGGMADAEAMQRKADRLVKLSNRRTERNARMGVSNPTGLGEAVGATVGGGKADKQSVGDKAGLSATLGGSKSTTVNIHLEALVKGLTMNVADAKVGVEELKDMVIDELTRILAGAQAAAQ